METLSFNSILIVDDEEAIRRNLRFGLADHGFRVLEAANGREALAVMEQERLALVLTDLRMPEMDGLSLIAALVRNYPELPVIVISGVGVVHEAIEAVRLGAWDYLSKPLHDQDAVLLVIERALERARLMAENRRYRESLEELVRERTVQLEATNRELEQEVTERKRMEEDFLKLNAELSATLQTIPDLLLELDQHGIYLNVWAQDSTLLAAHQEQLLGHSVSEVLNPEAAETVMAALREADENDTSYGKIIHIDFPTGPKWFELSVSCKRCINGIDRHFMLLSRDVTDRKRMEDALRFVAQRGWQSSGESFFDALVRYLGESLGVDYVIIDRIAEEAGTAETVAVYAKGATAPNMRYALKGTPCENVVGQHPCFYPQGVQQLFPEDTLLVEMGVESYAGIPLWDSSGRSIGLIAVMDSRPFSNEALINQLLQLVATRAASELEREQSDHVLRMREQEFRTLAENSPDNIARFDIHCRQIYVNPTMERTFGLAPALLLGKTPIEQAPGDLPKELGVMYENSLRQVLETGEPGEMEMPVPNPSGGLDTHLIRIVAERDTEGAIIGALAIGRDITERKRVGQQLELMRFALDHVGEAAYLVDDKACFHYVNEEACRALRCSRDELLARSIMEIDPDFPAFDWPALWNKLMSHGSLTFERRHKAADGHIFPVEIVTNYFEFGGQGFNLAMVRDITDRKRMEEVLRESEQQFRTLAENLPDNVARYDLVCRKVYANPQLEKTLGIPADSLIGITPVEGQGEAFRAYQDILEQILASGQDAEFDLTIPDAEKGIRYHNIRFVPERGADSVISGAMVIGRDITERKRMEQALQAERNLFVGGPNVAFRWQAAQGWPVEYVSPNITEQFGYTPQDFTSGKISYVGIIHPDDRLQVAKEVSEHCAVSTPCFEQEYRIIHADGSCRWIYDFTVVVRDADGMLTHFHGYITDITERKLAEEALQTKQRKLAELELELSFAEERERQRIASVLHDHIGQLLLLARIKLGTLLSGGEPVATGQTVGDVRTLVDEAIQSTRSLTVQLCPPVLSSMGLEPALELLCSQMLEEWELQVEFSDDRQPKPLPPEVRTVVYQTARELLINVGKHARTNLAELAIASEDSTFLLTVTDTGAGFDPDELAAASRQAKGFGIFNSMRRIRNLGGEMTMDSTPLHGTRVTIRIPLVS